MASRLDEWETLALALAAGLACEAAPAPVAMALVGAAVHAHLRGDATTQAHLPTLFALGAIALAGLIGGPSWIIAAALLWRVWMGIEGAAGATSPWLCWSLPATCLLLQFDAPPIAVWGAGALALALWADWAIRRLADWRLGASGDAGRFMLGQAALVTPLALLPSPTACLAALIAMAIAVRWRASPAPAYAAA